MLQVANFEHSVHIIVLSTILLYKYMADGLWVDGFIRVIGTCGIING